MCEKNIELTACGKPADTLEIILSTMAALSQSSHAKSSPADIIRKQFGPRSSSADQAGQNVGARSWI